MKSKFTEEEILALQDFRTRISDVISTYDEHAAHDNNLIRWLRATNLNVRKAEEMVRKQVKFREETYDLQYLPFPEDLLLKLPFRVVGYDKEGHMVVVIPAGIWEFKKLVVAGRNKEIQLYLAQIFERYFRYMKTICSVENYKTQVVLIVDFENFSIPENISPPVLSFFRQLLQLFDQNCPEMMKTAYAINIPTIFSVGWSLVYPFLAERTVKKVKIISGGPAKWRKILQENIDPIQLPSDYGGTNTAHPFYSNRLGETWPKRAEIFSPEEFSTVSVPPREKFIKSYELMEGAQISWNFKTDLYDIGFQVNFNGQKLFPYSRADAHLHLQDGYLEVTEAGTYSLIFDNSYSKYRAKTLHYVVLVEDANDNLNSAPDN